MGGGVWPYSVGGVICLVHSVDERDLCMLDSVKDDSFLITSKRDFVCLTQGSSRQYQVCNALMCSGLHSRHTDVFNEFLTLPETVG